MALHLSLIHAMLAALAAQAEPAEQHGDLLHSDVPLWGVGSEGMWPQAFSNTDTFGCRGRLRYGAWRFDEHGRDEETWYQFTNYGVFHCFMWVRYADERDDLGTKHPIAAFLIELGTTRSSAGPVELWVLQQGTRPGSDYVLLARPPAQGPVTSFDVLQRECPHGRMREGPGMDILSTRYCAINDRRELIQLARRMARRPPLGRLTFVGLVEDEDDE